MKNEGLQDGVREFLTVTGIAAAIAGAMTLLAMLPPFSRVYRWLEKRDEQHLWTALTVGVTGGVLGFYRDKQEEKERG